MAVWILLINFDLNRAKTHGQTAYKYAVIHMWSHFENTFALIPNGYKTLMDVIIGNLRTIIENKCLKMNYVAQKAGFTPQEFSNLLCGRNTFKADYVEPICKALEVTPNDLY